MKRVKVDPSILDHLQSFMDANPMSAPAVVVALGLIAAAVVATVLR